MSVRGSAGSAAPREVYRSSPEERAYGRSAQALIEHIKEHDVIQGLPSSREPLYGPWRRMGSQSETVHSQGPIARFGRVAMGGSTINRSFAGVLGAAFVSQLGTQIGFLAFPLIATVTMRATPFEISLLYSVGWLPYLFLFVPVGRLADRGLRVPLMIFADLARCLLIVLIPLLYFLGWLALWQLYVVALAVGIFGALFDVSDQALLPAIVESRDLLRANVLLETSNSTTRIVGPGAAGGVIALIGPPAALLVDGASYLLSASMLSGIRAREVAATPNAVFVDVQGSDETTGLRYVLRHPVLRTLFLSKAVGNTGWAFIEALFIVYAVRVIHVHAALIGVIYLVGNAGLLVGARLARKLTVRFGRKGALSAGLALQAVGVAAIPLALTRFAPAILAVGLAMRAFGLVLYNVNQATARQTVTPPRLLGRVSAAMRIGDVGVLPAGYLIGGALAVVLPLRDVFFIATGFLAVAFAMMSTSNVDTAAQPASE